MRKVRGWVRRILPNPVLRWIRKVKACIVLVARNYEKFRASEDVSTKKAHLEFRADRTGMYD